MDKFENKELSDKIGRIDSPVDEEAKLNAEKEIALNQLFVANKEKGDNLKEEVLDFVKNGFEKVELAGSTNKDPVKANASIHSGYSIPSYANGYIDSIGGPTSGRKDSYANIQSLVASLSEPWSKLFANA